MSDTAKIWFIAWAMFIILMIIIAVATHITVRVQHARYKKLKRQYRTLHCVHTVFLTKLLKTRLHLLKEPRAVHDFTYQLKEVDLKVAQNPMDNTIKYCPICEVIVEHSRYCHNCGQKLFWPKEE